MKRPSEKNYRMPYKGKLLVSNIFRKRIDTSLKLASLKDNFVILDIGCRDGFLLKQIRNLKSNCYCYGIEKDSEVLEEVEGCDIRIADTKNLPFKNNFFDVVFALDVLEHIKEIETAILEIKRVLKNEGIIVVSGPTESWFYKFCRFLYVRTIHHDEHVHTIYDIEKKFETCGFRIIEKKSLPEYLPELFRIIKFSKMNSK